MSTRKGFREVTKSNGSKTTVKIGSIADRSYDTNGILVGAKRTPPAPETGGGNTSGYSSLKDMSIGLAGGGKGTGSSDTPIRRYTQTPYEEAMGDGPTDFTDDDADKIRRERYRQAQGQIDSIHDVFNQKLASAQAEGKENLGRTRAITSRGGLTGSGRGEAMRESTLASNKGKIDEVEAGRMEKVNSIFADIDRRADTEIEARRAEARGDKETYVNFLKEQGESAKQQMNDLAGMGVTIDELAPEDKADFLKYTGMDEMTFTTMWNHLLPKEAKTDYKFEVTDRGIVAYGINPKTGELDTKTFSMPSALMPGEELKEFNGVLYATSVGPDGKVILRPIANDGTQGGGGGGTYVEGANPEVDSWVALISRGEAKLDDVPAKLKNAVAGGLAGTQSKATSDKIAGLQDVLTLATELQTLDGKGAAVGAGFKKGLGNLIPGISADALPGSARASYEAKAKQLIDTLASTNLDKLKGAMSDKDIEFLRNIGSGLNMNMLEKDWDGELTKIINKVNTAIADNVAKTSVKAGSVTSSNMESFLDANPEVDTALQEAIAANPDMTDEEILYFINGK